jgi:hypothetical protein
MTEKELSSALDRLLEFYQDYNLMLDSIDKKGDGREAS